MSSKMEFTGKTVEDAIKNALKELKTTKENIDIEVLEEPSKGVLGSFLGGKSARIKVFLLNKKEEEKKEEKKHYRETKPLEEEQKKQIEQKILSFMKDVFDKMNLEISTNVSFSEDDTVNVVFEGERIGEVIGYRGDMMDALQTLIFTVVNKNSNQFIRVVTDAQNYRKKREETLVNLANKMADKVVKRGRSVSIKDLTSYERRIIHMTLQEHAKVKTESKGEEPYRKIIISLK